MIFVVGSGPAGVSVAAALLEHGVRVTMLDAGLELEPERRATVRRMRAALPQDWSPDDLSHVKEGMAPGVHGVPLKYVFGSDFPYRGTERFIPLARNGVESAVTFARGGFSNVWGSAVLPYRDDDLGAWPFRLDALDPHYRAVASLMGISCTDDALQELFPLYTDEPFAVTPSRQAQAMLADLDASGDALRRGGVHFGRARVAIDPGTRERQGACTYCGLCMYGCPHDLIYNSASTLERLRAHPNFTYVPGVVLERVEERDGAVHLCTRDLSDGNVAWRTSDRACLACGPVATSRILMASLELYDQPVSLLDSQYFLLPLLRFRGVPGVARERLHTLAQLFLEIVDSAVSDHTVHLQLYTYNDMYDATFRAMLGRLHGFLRIPVEQIVNRMVVVQGFLHSDHSQRIQMRLARGRDGTPAELHLDALPSREMVRMSVGRVVNKLWSLRGAMRAIPVRKMLTLADAGRGFHSGGSFPMSEAPSTTCSSDVLGRPAGFSRVHVVDSTVFPSIPATTITFTVMANAHRIGAQIHDC
jgi:choline dehydrogenase-like flavoprotein